MNLIEYTKRFSLIRRTITAPMRYGMKYGNSINELAADRAEVKGDIVKARLIRKHHDRWDHTINKFDRWAHK